LSTHAVILAGGAGTRFWPAGRRARPKQLLSILADRTLLAQTLDRCAPLAPVENTWIITNEQQVELTRQECPRIPPGQIVAEPLMRNTAAAIGLASHLIRKREGDEAIMAVMPADHAIRPQERFLDTFAAAIERAGQGDVLVTIGVVPAGPATGYGYIEGGDEVARIGGHTVLRARSFKEKPNAATAGEFLESGRYFWNSGTFVWTVGSFLKALQTHLPGHDDLLGRAVQKETIDRDLYARIENVPVDIGVMEKAENVEVIPADFEWDDVGSWLALTRLGKRDPASNVSRGRHVELDCRNCIIVSGEKHLVATLGIENLIVVHTPDATLVCRKDRAEDVRAIVERLREKGLEEYL
jgi:mannose-1-phosphate guanylyltransferase